MVAQVTLDTQDSLVIKVGLCRHTKAMTAILSLARCHGIMFFDNCKYLSSRKLSKYKKMSLWMCCNIHKIIFRIFACLKLWLEATVQNI